MENKITEDLVPSREVWFCLKGWWGWPVLSSNSESWTAPEVILLSPPTEQGGWACGGVERRGCHHGKQDAVPGVDTSMTQHRFFSHSTQAYVLSPAPSQNKFQVSHWGGAGEGEIPVSEEDLFSLRNTPRGAGVTACGPAVHYGCPANTSVYWTLRRNHSHLSNPLSSSPIPFSLMAMIQWPYLPRICLLCPFPLFPSLRLWFRSHQLLFNKVHWSWDAILCFHGHHPHLGFLLLWPPKEVFLASSFSPPAPISIRSFPSLLFIILY